MRSGDKNNLYLREDLSPRRQYTKKRRSAAVDDRLPVYENHEFTVATNYIYIGL